MKQTAEAATTRCYRDGQERNSRYLRRAVEIFRTWRQHLQHAADTAQLAPGPTAMAPTSERQSDSAFPSSAGHADSVHGQELVEPINDFSQ